MDPVVFRQPIKNWIVSSGGTLPEGWYVTPSIGDSISVKWTHPEYGQEFLLLRVKVSPGGKVEVIRDFRPQVEKILSSPSGLATEARYFRVLATPSSLKPLWFGHVTKANQSVNRRGVDGFARIFIGDERIKLPFDIKSRKIEIKRYYDKRPSYKGIVSAILVRTDDSDETLHLRTYTLFGEIRSKMLKEGIAVEEMKRRITECINPPAAR